MSGGAAMILAALLAGEGLPASPCAGLPEKGPVALPAVDVVPAEPTAARGWHCPDDYGLDLSGRLPVCRGGVAAAPGNPRARCLAALALGPMAPLPTRARPTVSCAAGPLTTVLPLRGPGLGWRDTVVAAAPASGVTITTLTDGAAPPAANPLVRGCFAPDCRLVRLTLAADAAPEIILTASLPGGGSTSQGLKLARYCPRP